MANHEKMTLEMRAKQFMPFSALTGLNEALKRKENEHEETNIKYLKAKEINEIKNIINNFLSNKTKQIQITYEDENGFNFLTCCTSDLNLNNLYLEINNYEIKYNQIIQIKLLN